MHFQIKKIGHLEVANINLNKDLIVFTGRNNTYKTYVAHAIYGLCSSLPYYLAGFFLKNPIDIPESAESFEIDLSNFVKENIVKLVHYMQKEYKLQLPDIFASATEFTGKTEIDINFPKIDLTKALHRLRAIVIDSTDNVVDKSILVKKQANSSKISFSTISRLSTIGLRDGDPNKPDFKKECTMGIGFALWRTLFYGIHMPLVLSAERSAIQLFSHELSLRRNELVDKMLSKGTKSEEPLSILKQQARRYSLPIRDGLHIADDLANLRKKTAPTASLADWLEQNVLHGAVKVDDDGEMNFQPDHEAIAMPLHLASSSVKVLSGLVFALRHLIGQNTFLIIDEPELNLHPDNQRLIARLIARVVKLGVKVLISTHSDYIVRELNNLIMLEAVKENGLHLKHGYSDEDLLSGSQVGAYLFAHERATEKKVTDTGIEIASVDEEINKLNFLSQKLYFNLMSNKKAVKIKK